MNKINAVKDAVMEKTHMGGGSHQTGVGGDGHKGRHTTGEVGDSRAMIHHGPGETGQFRGTHDGVVGTEIGHSGMGADEFGSTNTPAGIETSGLERGGIEDAARPATIKDASRPPTTTGVAPAVQSPAAPASTGGAATTAPSTY